MKDQRVMTCLGALLGVEVTMSGDVPMEEDPIPDEVKSTKPATDSKEKDGTPSEQSEQQEKVI